MKKKSIIALVLSLAMVMCCAFPTFAAEVQQPGGSGSVPVELTAEAATFSVTVPTSLPVSVSATGVVTCATNATITNLSHGAVKVVGLGVEGVGAWQTADYDTFETAVLPVGSKMIALEVNGDKTTADDVITFTAANYGRMTGADASSDADQFSFTYDAKVAAQSQALSGLGVANVIFTIDWDYAA